MREFYTENIQSNKSLQKKGGIIEVSETVSEQQKKLEQQYSEGAVLTPEQIEKLIPYTEAPPDNKPQIKVPQARRAVFTIFDTFKNLGYTKEEVLSVIPELPNLDRKRLELRNGSDLDNPVISPRITERDRNLYITKTLPKVEELLVKKYGHREPPEESKPKVSIYDKKTETSLIPSGITIFEQIDCYSREEILTIILQLPKNDKKRVDMMNGPDLDNPVKVSNISPEIRELYATKTIPTIEKMLRKQYGPRQSSKVSIKKRLKEISRYIKEMFQFIKEPYDLNFLNSIKTDDELQSLEIYLLSEIKKLSESANLLEEELKIILFKCGFIEKCKTDEQISEILNIKIYALRQIEIKIFKKLQNSPYAKKFIENTSPDKIKELSKLIPYEKEDILQVVDSEETIIEKPDPGKEEIEMRKLTIYKYFEEYGYTKEQVKEIIKELTEKQIEYLKVRNGNDLDNPVYIGNLDPNQRSQYASTLKRIMKKLEEKYGKNGAESIQEEIDEISAQELATNSSGEEHKTEAIIATQSEPKISGEQIKEIKRKGRQKKSLIERFKEIGYTREQILLVIEELPEKYKECIKLIDGEEIDHPVKSKEAAKKDEVRYYTSVISNIKRNLEKKYGIPNQQSSTSQKENVAKLDSKHTEEMVSIAVEPINESEYLEQTQPSTKEISEIPQTRETKATNITKEECTRILELIKTPTFTELMTQLNPKSGIIIALRLGYVDGKYFTSESIASFLGIEVKEVIETTKEVLNLYKQNINSFIDTAISYIEPETKGPARRLIPENNENK